MRKAHREMRGITLKYWNSRWIRRLRIPVVILLLLLLVPLSPVIIVRMSHSEETTTIVSLTFDDGYSGWTSMAMPILASYNLTATAFINDPDHAIGMALTWADARELFNAGWEIGWHTSTHFDLDITDSEIIVSDFSQVKTLFRSHGLPPPETFAYPSGRHDNDSMEIVSQYFTAARTVHPGINTPYDVHQNAYHLKGVFVNSAIGLDVPYLKAKVEKYIGQGVFIVLYLHTVGEPPPYQEEPDITVEEFAELAEFLAEQEEAGNIDVVTFIEGVSRFQQMDVTSSLAFKFDSPFDKWYHISRFPVPARYYDFYMELIMRDIVGHRFPRVVRWVEQITLFNPGPRLD